MMKGLPITGFLAMLATPAASIARTSFHGTWKVDLISAAPKKVRVSVGLAMVNRSGHETGNGGYSRGTPTADQPRSYSER
jgi:hypothetical protein